MSEVVKLPKQYRVAQRWVAVCYRCASVDNLTTDGIRPLSDGRAPLIVTFPRRRFRDAQLDARRHEQEAHS